MRRLLCVLCVLLSFVPRSLADEVTSAVQRKLLQGGYYHGIVDGSMGSQTAAAIRRYQVAQKLEVTGQLNPQTLQSLGIHAPGRSEGK